MNENVNLKTARISTQQGEAAFPRFLTLIDDERIGDPPLIFDADKFDFQAWMMQVFGAEYESTKTDLEARAYAEQWDDDELADAIDRLNDEWFNPDNYRGETIERVAGNVYEREDSRRYGLFPNGDGSYESVHVD